jgi:CelD/BcsL family acetyltransferase involved in cellulose biosynthesis
VPVSGQSFAIEIATERARLASIADAWRALAIPTGNAFVTPEWYFSFLDHASHVRPFAVIVREEGKLLGLLTLVEHEGTVRFAGAGAGDCFRPLLAAGAPAEVIDLAVGQLAAATTRWKLAVLDRLEPQGAGPLAAALRLAGATVVTSGRDTLPTIELSGRSWKEYLNERSHNLRSELGRKERALARGHNVEFVEMRSTDELPKALDDHSDLHELRWPVASRTRLRSERLKAFHRDFARAAASQGWLRIWRLEVDQRPVASWYGWNIGGRYSYYQAGLDPEWARFSPGTLLLARTIRAAIDERCWGYDFLRGDESYKRRFSNSARQTTSLTAARRLNPPLAAAAGLWAARRCAQQLPPWAKRTMRRAKRAGR